MIARDGNPVHTGELTAGRVAALYGLPDDGEDSDLGEYDLTLRRRVLARADRPPLTPRQADVLAAIVTMTAESGYAPSIRELCEQIGVRSTCTVQRHIEALIHKGYVTRMMSGARTLIVLHTEDRERARVD